MSRPHSVSLPKVRESRAHQKRPYSSDSTDTGDDFGKKLSEMQISDEAWEGDHEDIQSTDSSPDGEHDWSKVFKTFEAQTELMEAQIMSPVSQSSTGSLDRRAIRNSAKQKERERQKVRRNWSHSTSRGATSQGDLRPYTTDRNKRRCASTSSAKELNKKSLRDQLKTVLSPQPIQLHRVTLVKETPGEDFGFGVSDGVYEKGVYISAVRPGSVADRMGLKQYDRILQINKKRTRDFDCTLAIPLISNAGKCLDIVVCRNPLTHKKTALIDHNKRRKPPPEPPEESCDMEDQSGDSNPVYMNVYNLDTPIARSEKSCKTV